MKKNSSIRTLENKASKGDIDALFQLAQYYEKGQYVEQNNEQASLYYQKVVGLFKKPEITLYELKLVNFRLFNNIKITFPNIDNLTVFIGSNGAGKTTILEAISKSLSWFIQYITTQAGKGDLIKDLEINNQSGVDYASVICNLVVDKKQYLIELSKSKSGSNRKRSGEYEQIKQLTELYKFAHSKDKQFNLPILVYYSVERALDVKDKDVKIKVDEITEQKKWNQFYGYHNALNGSADFDLFFRWFKYLDDLNNAETGTKQDVLIAINRLKAELDSDLVKELEERFGTDAETVDVLSKLKKEKQEKITQLQVSLDDGELTKSRQVIDTVTRAIYAFMPGFSDLRIQRSPSIEMLITKNDDSLNILQLSQGEKSLIALVADIARRLVLLNPSLKEPLHGHGIVLIDEIDLHLHPEWQQSIVPNLIKTFPNIQFIITTHSPQVLTTVDDRNVFILKNGRIYNAPKGTKGAESSRMLKRAFEVEPRPKNDPVTKKLKEYKDYVFTDNWECEEAQKLRCELNETFGEEEPELTELDLYIENRVWEMELEKNK